MSVEVNDHVQWSAIRLGFSFIHLAANFVASRPGIPYAGVYRAKMMLVA